jgi:Fur family zinc uptake transcriptional regulator
MASHLHHDLVGENLIDAARNALVVAGEQWTDMRADVFEALAAQHKPASAYDIAERRAAPRQAGCRQQCLSHSRPVRADQSGAQGRKRECLCGQPPSRMSPRLHFPDLRSCGQATHIDDDRLTDALRKAAVHAGFADVRPVVEIRGVCSNCAGA